MRRILILTAILSASPAATGGASEPNDERRDESTDAERGAQAAAPEWGVELFARGGLAGLTAHGDVLWEGTVLATPEPFPGAFLYEASHYGRTPAWGAGFRAMRGRWGLETQYVRIRSGVFQPGSVIRESPFDPLHEMGPGGGPEDLIVAQGIFQFPIRADRARIFLGIGAGLARTPALEQGRRPGLPISDFFPTEAPLPPGLEALPSLSFDYSPGPDGTHRHSLLLGGSFGMGLRTGGLFIRPRIDVFFGPTHQNVSSWSSVPGKP